jgi:hypothetical protein
MNAKLSMSAGKLPAAQNALRACILALAAQLATGHIGWAQAPSDPGFKPPATQEAEIALALSACPQSVASGAAVYVLGKAGYVKVRDSRNGFTAIVQHSVPTSQEPQCMDQEGSRTYLPRYLKVAELRAQGKSPEEIRRFVAEAFLKGIFQAPTRPGIDYMLSTQNFLPDDKGQISHFPPHLMFYGPYLRNADIGSPGQQPSGNLVFVAGEGAPQALIIVPVGSSAEPAHTEAHQH